MIFTNAVANNSVRYWSRPITNSLSMEATPLSSPRSTLRQYLMSIMMIESSCTTTPQIMSGVGWGTMTRSGLFDVSPWSGFVQSQSFPLVSASHCWPLDNRVYIQHLWASVRGLVYSEFILSQLPQGAFHTSWSVLTRLPLPVLTRLPLPVLTRLPLPVLARKRNLWSKDPLTALILYNIENIKIITQ